MNSPSVNQHQMHVPQEPEELKRAREQFEQREARLDQETNATLKAMTNIEADTHTMLGIIKSKLDEFGQVLKEPESGSAPQGASAEDVKKLRSWEEAAVIPIAARMIFFQELLKLVQHVGGVIQSRGNCDALVDLPTADSFRR
jgi:hypothetical protein